MKLLIAIPALDYIHADFVKCLIKLKDHIAEEQIEHEVALFTGTLVYDARERIVSKAINEGYTHVLWMDADMIFNPEMFDDLLDVDKDIVTGRFVSRRRPFVPCQFSSLDNLERVDDYPLNPFRISGTGFAFTLVKAAALRTVFKQFGTCFLPMKGFGEDLAFCKRCKDAGVEIWCEPTVQVGHISHIPVYPGDDYSFMRSITC